MANIREYTNTEKLSPTDLGFTARETAARRIGPLAKETAADVEKGGRLQGELFGQAEKDQALAIKALNEGGGRGGRGGGGGGGGGGIIGAGGSHGGGGGGGYARPDTQWADTANQVTYTALALSSHDHGTDGHMGKLIDASNMGAPLYTTGQPDSTPTASGSYGNQGFDNLSGGSDLTPTQIASDLKQGDALYKYNWQGRTILDGNNKPTDRLYQPITSPGSDTTINGVTVNGPGSGATSTSLWDSMVGLASRGFSAIDKAYTAASSNYQFTPPDTGGI